MFRSGYTEAEIEKYGYPESRAERQLRRQREEIDRVANKRVYAATEIIDGIEVEIRNHRRPGDHGTNPGVTPAGYRRPPRVPGRKTGRPTLYNTATLQHIVTNIEKGLSLHAAAEYAGLTYETLRTWRVLDEAGDPAYRGVNAAVDEARRQRTYNILAKADKAADKDGAVALKLLALSDPANFAPNYGVNLRVSGQVQHEHQHSLKEPGVPNPTMPERSRLAEMLGRPMLPDGYYAPTPLLPGDEVTEAEYSEMDFTDDDQDQ